MPGADQARYLGAGLFQRLAYRGAEAMDRGGVAIELIQEGQHHIPDQGIDTGGGIVVEIDGRHDRAPELKGERLGLQQLTDLNRPSQRLGQLLLHPAQCHVGHGAAQAIPRQADHHAIAAEGHQLDIATIGL